MRNVLLPLALLLPLSALAEEAPAEPAPVEAGDEEVPADPAVDDRGEDKVEDRVEDPDDTPAPASRPASQPASAPAPPPPPAETADDMVNLRVDPELDARLESCMKFVEKGDLDRARACLDEVAAAKETTAGLRAGAAKRVFTLTYLPEPRSGMFAPGRLELTSISGLFGVWNGVALGISATSAINFDSGAAPILLTGGLGVALGVGYGFGGYYLAEGLGLSAGDARLVSSGLIWGTWLGGWLAVPIVELAGFSNLSTTIGLMTVVGMGWVGGGAALTLATSTELSEGQVSFMNTGGWIGSLVAGMYIMGSLAVVPGSGGGGDGLMRFSLPMLVGNVGGLALGAWVGSELDFSWGEVLLVDLGGVLGLVTTGTLMLAALAGGVLDTLPQNVGVPIITTTISAGTVGGAALSAWLIHGARQRGEKTPEVALRGQIIPTMLVDKDQQATPGLGLHVSW